MKEYDVVIVGAGVSGIGAACRLRQKCRGKTFRILESRDAIGGTWDLFRYPGIRSDTELYSLSYDFKPWRDPKAIAPAASIRRYLQESAEEYDVTKLIRFRRRLESAAWASEDATWTLQVARTGGEGGTEQIRCNFLMMCSGYYSYDKPYRPTFAGEEDFTGEMFHAQLWPKDLDYKGKRLAVIGSGATAMTLVPATAVDAGHVTMVQRSPTYVVSYPEEDRLAQWLDKVLPPTLAFRLTRFRYISMQRGFLWIARRAPRLLKRILLTDLRRRLGREYVEKHFTPRYNPWDQRPCIIPNADLFKAIKSGKASVATGEIDRVTPTGIRLVSGQEIEADIIAVATGLNLQVLGNVRFEIDGQAAHLSDSFSYKGLMYSDVPNLVNTFGYIAGAWTLRADMTAEFTCRVLAHMDETGTRQCTPRLRDEDRDMPRRDWIEGFSSGYLKRGMHEFPKQGDHAPWLNPQVLSVDRKLILDAPLDDGVLTFSEPMSTAENARSPSSGSFSGRGGVAAHDPRCPV